MKMKRSVPRVEPVRLVATVIATLVLARFGFLLAFSPTQVKAVGANEIAWATDVTAGNSHSCALYNLGTPYCWGDNGDGQLGTGNLVNHTRPYPVNISGIPAGYVFKQISAGFYHTCAVVGLSSSDASDAVYCWGKNDRGQLGLGVANSTLVTVPTAVANPGGLVAKKVSAGFAHTCAIYSASGGAASTNKAYCWGNNDEGQLGDGSGVFDSTSMTFTTLPTSRFAPYPVQQVGINYPLEISAGAMSTCQTIQAKFVQCWGAGGSGQLGITGAASYYSYSNPTSAVASGISSDSLGVGWFYGCSGSLTNNPNMVCWGDNTSGQLGNGGNTSSVSAVPVTGLSGLSVKGIATGYAHTCAIAGASGNNASDTLYCWGENADGQVLNGNTGTNTNAPSVATLTNVPSGYTAKKVAAGWAHTMAIYSVPGSQVSGVVFGCGDNSDGQVGNNTMNSCNVMVPVDTTDVVGIDISLDLEVSSVQMTVTPSSGSVSGRDIATVTTQLPTGYALTMKANGANLVCSSGSAAGDTIPSLASDGALPAGESRWGWNLGTFSSGTWQAPTTWRTVPVATPALVAQTSAASASTGDDYGIFFGVRVNGATRPCDSYDQTLVLTATMNV